MTDPIVNVAAGMVSLLVPVLTVSAVTWLVKRLGTERLKRIQAELETKKYLATTAVQFAE